jgi:acyl dehydratase
MTIDIESLTGRDAVTSRRVYTRRDASLYAQSIGFGSDPLDELELDFVSDRPTFKSVPTMASIFADVILELTHACQLQHPELALHGEQKLEIFSPLPDMAELEIQGSIAAVYDRGPQRGAEIHMAAEARLQGESALLYRATYVTIARGDGGFGGDEPDRSVDNKRIPARAPDKVWKFPISRNQALLYSLNGDPNPIHTQPRIAKRAGFEKPIMHGLGTYGMACRAVIMTYCDGDPSVMKSFDVRFSAPVFPGDTLLIDMWRLDDGVAFQGRIPDRDVVVLKNGFSRIDK